MARRRRKMGKRRIGPGHNEQNKQNRESRSRSKMLDARREAHFRYDVEELLVNAGMEPEEWRPFLQTLWAQGNRQGMEEAQEWLAEQVAEGRIDGDLQKDVWALCKKYSTYR